MCPEGHTVIKRRPLSADENCARDGNAEKETPGPIEFVSTRDHDWSRRTLSRPVAVAQFIHSRQSLFSSLSDLVTLQLWTYSTSGACHLR